MLLRRDLPGATAAVWGTLTFATVPARSRQDRAVRDAYGWTDIEVAPYCPLTDADRQHLERFEDEGIDRLFLLNAQRAADEQRRGLAPAGAKQKSAAKGGRKKKTAAEDAQAQLALGAKGDED